MATHKQDEKHSYQKKQTYFSVISETILENHYLQTTDDVCHLPGSCP